MRKTKVLVAVMALGMTCAAVAPLTASATAISESNPEAAVQQKVTLVKEEAVVPVYTVEVPATVEIGQEAQDLKYTLTFENDEAFIPDDMKISVKIKSAGYPTELTKFAVWDSKNLQEASYEVYYSDRMAGGRYSIGDEIVSWTGSNWGTQVRRIKALDYESIQPGSYSGVINYTISLENA
ncbi:MAG: hypothetical protein ACI4GO_10740 [Hominenteromicrobium sp.]